MAAKANQQTEAEMQPQDSAAEAQDNDAAQQTLKTLMRLGKERGYVTHDELNAALPAEDFTSEQIDDFMSTLNEMGVSVVEAADSDDASEGESEEQRSTGNVSDSDVSGTDDPVRMYLREMGSVELLSREGEIAIAKRIEAGRELMIGFGAGRQRFVIGHLRKTPVLRAGELLEQRRNLVEHIHHVIADGIFHRRKRHVQIVALVAAVGITG